LPLVLAWGGKRVFDKYNPLTLLYKPFSVSMNSHILWLVVELTNEPGRGHFRRFCGKYDQLRPAVALNIAQGTFSPLFRHSEINV
jgi:hypothetical protein